MQVGDDEFGYMLVDILKENRVESRGVRFDPGARTALAFVTLRDDGEREFMFYRNPSADMLLETHEVDIALVQQVSRTFHTFCCCQCSCYYVLGPDKLFNLLI
jgi:fructokinase